MLCASISTDVMMQWMTGIGVTVIALIGKLRDIMTKCMVLFRYRHCQHFTVLQDNSV